MEQAARLIANPRPDGERGNRILDAAMFRVPQKAGWRHFRVKDDALAPALRVGDWVTVDITDRRPSPPGVFLIWSDIEGLALRDISLVANSSPMVVQVGGGYGRETEVAPLRSLCIEGRVCGVWKAIHFGG